MTTAPVLDRPPLPAAGRSRRWILVAVSLATFMTYLDNNIVNVAIPTIQRDLRLSTTGIEWVVSAYILLFAGLLLAGGRVADIFGRRRLFLAGLGVFTAASLAAGLAGSADVLIAARAVQGLGASLVVPSTLALISRSWPDLRERAAAIGAASAVGALALAVGPLLGGLLSQHAGWHWIFTINVPIGVATIALGAWAVPVDRPAPGRSLDMAGVLTSALALVALTYGLIEGPQLGWTRPVVIGALAVAAAAGTAFVAVERAVPDPMIDLTLFAGRTFAGGVGALMLWAFGLFGIYFFTSLYLQDVLHFGPTEAGLAFVPMAVLMAAGAAVSDRAAARLGAHRSVGTAMLLMGAGILSVSVLGPHASFVELMPGFVVIGVGGGLTIPLTSTILGLLPDERAGVASAVFNASREVVGLLGITVIGVILRARQSAALHAGASPLGAFLSGYRLGLVVAGVLVAAGGVLAWRTLPRTAGPMADAPLPAPVL